MDFKFLLMALLPSLVGAFPGYHEPWGKDTDLTYSPAVQTQQINALSQETPFATLMKQLIHFHQTVISPVDGPRSHYRPSSSTYMKMAINQYGFVQGYLMGCDRLMRENSDPWVYRTQLIHGKVWKIDYPR